MKKVTVKDLEINPKDAVITDCPIKEIVGSNIARLVYMANNNFVIIATPWDKLSAWRNENDYGNPDTWLLSDLFYNLPSLYTIQFDGWIYEEGVDCSERDYFSIYGFTTNKECIEEMEEVMHCRFEFDIAYGRMYNFDENYNIITEKNF